MIGTEDILGTIGDEGAVWLPDAGLAIVESDGPNWGGDADDARYVVYSLSADDMRERVGELRARYADPGAWSQDWLSDYDNTGTEYVPGSAACEIDADGLADLIGDAVDVVGVGQVIGTDIDYVDAYLETHSGDDEPMADAVMALC